MRLAGIDKIADSFKTQFGGSASGWFALFLGVAVVVLLAALARMFFSPAAKLRRAHRASFSVFAGASGLTADEIRLLWRVAEHYQLERPHLIFVKRSIFEGAVTSLAIDSVRADAIRQKVYSA